MEPADIAYNSPERREPEADIESVLEPVVIKICQEDRGWFVEHQGRIGPFFSKKTATDLAVDWVAALRASGKAAGLLFVDAKSRGADAPAPD